MRNLNNTEIKDFMIELCYELSKVETKVDMFKAIKKEESLTSVVRESNYGFKVKLNIS